MKSSTLAAAAILLVLGGYIYLYEREPAVEEEGERVFDVGRDDVVRIAIEERGKAPVVLEKVEGAWRITAPTELDADSEEVTLLLDNLETMRFERAVAKASEVELESFGLDEPVVSVAFRLESGEERSLRFGDDTPRSGNRYAMRADGDEILVLDSYLSLNFEKTAWDLRDKVIFHPPAEAEVERIAITRGASELVLARVREPEDGGYRIESPFVARADRFEAEALARAIRTAEMQALVESDEGEGAFDAVVARVELTLSDGEPLVLEVGAKKDFDYFGRSPSREERFLLEGSLVDDVTAEATAYAAKKLFGLAATDVAAFRIDERVFERGDDESWRRTAPPPIEGHDDSSEPDADSVRRLLDRLTGMSAGEVVLADEVPAFEPLSSVTLLTNDDPPREERLEIGAGSEGSLLLRRAGEGVFLRVPEASWAEVEDLFALGAQP